MPRPKSRSRGFPLLATALFAALFLAPLAPVAAQAGRRQVSQGIQRRIDSISPTSGPPGTIVRVESGEMPSITPIRVGIGAIRSGFEAYEELLTSMDGEFAVTVRVPDWAQWDRVHRFIVFDIYFHPIALSDDFHVTNAEGLVRREGHVLPDAKAPCWHFQDIDGIDYTLVGDMGDFGPGDQAIFDGPIVDDSRCAIKPTIKVVRARPRPGSGSR